jgi:hypothetical protein
MIISFNREDLNNSELSKLIENLSSCDNRIEPKDFEFCNEPLENLTDNEKTICDVAKSEYRYETNIADPHKNSTKCTKKNGAITAECAKNRFNSYYEKDSYSDSGSMRGKLQDIKYNKNSKQVLYPGEPCSEKYLHAKGVKNFDVWGVDAFPEESCPLYAKDSHVQTKCYREDYKDENKFGPEATNQVSEPTEERLFHTYFKSKPHRSKEDMKHMREDFKKYIKENLPVRKIGIKSDSEFHEYNEDAKKKSKKKRLSTNKLLVQLRKKKHDFPENRNLKSQDYNKKIPNVSHLENSATSNNTQTTLIDQTPNKIIDENSVASEKSGSSKTPNKVIDENSVASEKSGSSKTPNKVIDENSVASEKSGSSKTPSKVIDENSVASEKSGSSKTPNKIIDENSVVSKTPSKIIDENSVASEKSSVDNKTPNKVIATPSIEKTKYVKPILSKELNDEDVVLDDELDSALVESINNEINSLDSSKLEELVNVDGNVKYVDLDEVFEDDIRDDESMVDEDIEELKEFEQYNSLSVIWDKLSKKYYLLDKANDYIYKLPLNVSKFDNLEQIDKFFEDNKEDIYDRVNKPIYPIGYKKANSVLLF